MTLDLSGASDGELAALQLSGSDAAASEIMRRHREPIYRLVQNHIGDANEALDVTQEAFIAAFTGLRSYDQTRPFRVWLSRIAINKCRDWARRRAVRRFFTFASPIEASEKLAAEHVPADEMLAAAQELEVVRRSIAALPAALKEPLILRTIEGLSEAETAQALGISNKAVETRLYRARGLLKQMVYSN